ncbi:acyl-CoA thioesterase [Testudinibacter sp. TR-2022]|uniref:acyl-CoA thioesterase n=1 Tax=Testudinibacter sp. TR-2022 TaxID=2585029 RepID=UPI00111B3AA7|nr:thioesterase family protein [Testudinibacter sp. TR-2022]TNH05996.1 acyl-CoA thioesterase [Pasteurellaceae bacterium Phil11]TNH24303.1 acyl-CoA thioesterase [Testudinibacter sp. TR-2022]TNH26894.1 acyl-CoA thioesterase [Testudinibacter sp. TR-2022]
MTRYKTGLVQASVQLKPAFQDLDPMQVVWHGRYWQFIEEARIALFDKLGYGYREMVASGYQWPVVKAEIKYIRPIVLDQQFTVTADLIEFENQVKIAFTFRDYRENTVLCRASSTQVAVRLGGDELQFVTPDCWQNKVRCCLNATTSNAD